MAIFMFMYLCSKKRNRYNKGVENYFGGVDILKAQVDTGADSRQVEKGNSKISDQEVRRSVHTGNAPLFSGTSVDTVVILDCWILIYVHCVYLTRSFPSKRHSFPFRF